jgi:hypothetical protein
LSLVRQYLAEMSRESSSPPLPAHVQQQESQQGMSSELSTVPPSDQLEDPFASNSHDDDEDIGDIEIPDDVEIPGDIVPETQSLWNRLRNKKNAQGSYNISSFLSKWVENPPRAKKLAKALRNPEIQAALQIQGITITINDGSSIPVGGTFDTQTIRREMKGLLDEPSFADFKPHKDSQEEEDPMTIEKVTRTVSCC